MKIIKSIKKINDYLIKQRRYGKTIGFVPTMGYFHEGHLSLMRKAKKECDIAVVSVFVNPTQFGPKEDFNKYPRNFKRDLNMAKSAGVDVIFNPEVSEMYPSGYSTFVDVSGDLASVLCGASRPGHFRGVATVVSKLFNIVRPDTAYFGQKDSQQCAVIKQMIKDLNIPVKIKIMPIVREKDNLAMSSRNVYLSKEERKIAPVLYNSLQLAKRMIKNKETNSSKIILQMKKLVLSKKNTKIDYISIVNPETLEEVKNIRSKVLIALAVKLGKTRLIDNIVVSP